MALFGRHEHETHADGGDDDGPGTVRFLKVYISAHITGQEALEHSIEVPVSPDYDVADIRALMARRIEDVAFQLNEREFHRVPTKDALIAAVSRLRAIRTFIQEHPGWFREQARARIAEYMDVSNAVITEQWGEQEDPES